MLLALLLACAPDKLEDTTPAWTMRFDTADDVLLGFIGAFSADIARRETDPTWPECPYEDDDTPGVFTTDCTDGDGFAWTGTRTVTGGVTDGVQQYTFAHDAFGWVGGAGSVSLDGAIEVTYDTPELTEAGDTTVVVRGSPNRDRSDYLPSFPILDGEEHTFLIEEGVISGDTTSRTIGGDVTIDGSGTLRADGTITLGGDTTCTANASRIGLELAGANNATVTLDAATSCSCVTVAIDGEDIGQSCLEVED